MAVAIKPLDEIVRRWTEITPTRSEDFRIGVQDPEVEWAAPTLAANDTWKSAVRAGELSTTYRKGIREAGTDKWQRKTLSVGVQRWGPGVAAGRGNYEAGFAPYHDVISRTALPKRFPAGDPRNIQRVQVISDALHQRKLSLT